MNVFTKPRAMLIDSSVESATHMRALLTKASIDVVEWAVSGSLWLEAWQKAKVDLVVVDYVLPRRDGLYVVETIFKHTHHCAVLMTHSYTGWPANHIELRALELGAGGVLQKPFSEARLTTVLDRILAAARKNKAPTKVKLPGL